MTKIIVSLEFTYDPDAGEVRLTKDEGDNEQRYVTIRRPNDWECSEVFSVHRFISAHRARWEAQYSRGCPGYSDNGCELGSELYNLIKDRAESML